MLSGLDLKGTIVSLDGVYDCRGKLQIRFSNRGMIPTSTRSTRQKNRQRGRKPIFNAAISKSGFHTIERVFGWEDKFRRLLLRFED